MNTAAPAPAGDPHRGRGGGAGRRHRAARLRALVLISRVVRAALGRGDRTAPQGRQRGRQPALRGPWRHPPGRLPHRHPEVGQAPRGGGAPARPRRPRAPPGASTWSRDRRRCCSRRHAVGVTSTTRCSATYLAPALESIGREGVRVHDLRHFAGTQTARVGSLVETMERLGHSTASASLLYQQRVVRPRRRDRRGAIAARPRGAARALGRGRATASRGSAHSSSACRGSVTIRTGQPQPNHTVLATVRPASGGLWHRLPTRLSGRSTCDGPRSTRVRGPPRERGGSPGCVSARVFEFCSGLVDSVERVGDHRGVGHLFASAS